MTNKTSYSVKQKVDSIRSKINTQNTINDFLLKLPELKKQNASGLRKEVDSIFKIYSDLLNSVVVGQDNIKTLISDFVVKELAPIELETKKIIKKASFELLSCNVDSKLNVPFGVIDPSGSPYIEQFDFYGLFLKDINNPIEKLSFDDNLNTLLKTTIDNQDPSVIWSNKDGVNIVKFDLDYNQDKISIIETTPNNWGPSGVNLSTFVDLYIDEVTIFPKTEILKQLLDITLSVETDEPFELDFNEMLNLILKLQGKCNANFEDDRTKSTFDIGYEDFIPETNQTNQINEFNTELKFGPVDYPTPEIKSKKNINESLLNDATILTNNEFKTGKNESRKLNAEKYIDNITEASNNKTNDLVIQTPELKIKLDPTIKYDTNLRALLLLPSVLVMSLFSPKFVIYASILFKRYYVDDPNRSLWQNKDEYYLFVKRFIISVLNLLMRKILKMVWNKIKTEIIKMIKKTLIKILGEKLSGYLNQLKSLAQIVESLSGSIPPTLPRIKLTNCHSALDGLEQLFNIPNIPPGIPLPPGISFFGAFKSGLSPTQMTQQAIDKMNSLGLDTSPMPDGSPNPNILIANAISTAVITQIQQNARIQVDTIPLYGTGGATIT